MRKNKGFTLVEMLVVIAIVAILVAIIIPVVSTAIRKANAATDASNLRVALGELNVHAVDGSMNEFEIADLVEASECKTAPGAKMVAVYDGTSFVAVYYVSGSNYYSLEYLSDVASTGKSSVSTAKPSFASGTSTLPIG